MGRIDERIRARAQRIWEEEGRPSDKADMHWERAKQIVAMEESDRLAASPCPQADGTETPRTRATTDAAGGNPSKDARST